MTIINENVLICGVLKNCDKLLSNNIKLSIETGKIFKKYKIVIYENNSVDKTKFILQQYNHNENIKVISEDFTDEYIRKNSKVWHYTEKNGINKPCKIEQITNARNKVLEEIRKPEYSDYTYVIWIDMNSNGWILNGIIDSFIKKSFWDVIYANGLTYSSRKYYDKYSFRDLYYLFGPEIVGEYFWNTNKELNFLNEQGLVPVFSAFGGIGIFKKNIFDSRNYECIVNNSVKVFYRDILTRYQRILPQSLLAVIQSPGFFKEIAYKDETENIYWKSNSGYNKPVVSEHVALNMDLTNNSYKIFINPKMIYYY